MTTLRHGATILALAALAAAPGTARPASLKHLLTISIDDTPAGATLKVAWGTTVASVPFTVG